MKKALVLLLASIIGLIPTAVLAESVVPQPNLPNDFTKWPYSFSESCTPDDKNVYMISSFARIDPRSQSIEVVKTRTINGTPFYIWHAKGVKKGFEKSNFAYFSSANGWIKFDLNTNDINKMSPMINQGLQQAFNKDWNALMDVESCDNLEGKYWTIFFDPLVEKAERE